jgi:RNA polymerase primary sigma factor
MIIPRKSDSLQKYLASIDHPILTNDEEIEKAKKIEEKRELLYARLLISNPNFTEHYVPENKSKKFQSWHYLMDATTKYIRTLKYDLEGLREDSRAVKRLAKEIGQIESLKKGWQDAKNEVIGTNLKFVVSMASKYKKGGGRNTPLEDLIQGGNIGFFRALDTYDYRRGYRVCTYAVSWVKLGITHAARVDKPLVIPIHFGVKVRKVAAVEAKLEAENNGEKPSLDEIAGRAGYTAKQVINIKGRTVTRSEMNLKEEGIVAPSALEVMISDEIDEKVNVALKTLSHREEKIIRMRFGIGYDDTYTLREIGDLFKVTRERIRQLEASALKKLKNRGILQELHKAHFTA